MSDAFEIGPLGTLHVFGIKLVGINSENAGKLLISITFVLLALLVANLLRWLTRRFYREAKNIRLEFWTRQGINLAFALIITLGVFSIWFDDPTRLTTALGLVTAGLAFALQKVVSSFAGYVVLLRGRTFSVGDRIVMGGVRGDVVGLGFMQTSIMEMGQPPAVQADDPAMWIKSRQFTGRVVTVPNSKIFDEPVFNYTREFNFIWEEIILPISYSADRKTAEKILLKAARNHQARLSEKEKEEIMDLQRKFYLVKLDDFEPRVYYRLTDNWLELALRFMTPTHGIREIKDAMSREILEQIEEVGIGIASATFEIVGMPKLRLEGDSPGDQRPSRQRDSQGNESIN